MPEVQAVSSSDRGIEVLRNDSPVEIPWTSIIRVYAFKKDCYVVDQMRLLIFTQALMIELNEDQPGFRELGEELTRRLAMKKDWYLEWLLSPAFETNMTLVYQRATGMETE